MSGVAANTYDPSTTQAETEDWEFEVSLGYETENVSKKKVSDDMNKMHTHNLNET
jgi:hypothetical protein